MLIIALLKGVPARTTQVITAGGILRREEMEIVMNPYDAKTLQAADYVKRRVGGKIIALTIGPEPKLAPIMNLLYEPPPEANLIPKLTIDGVDECVILSDRRMAGADTLATSYAVALGIRKVVSSNLQALERLIRIVGDGEAGQKLLDEAKRLYELNLIPNHVYSTLPSVRDSLVQRLVEGKIGRKEAFDRLKEALESTRRFLVIAGMKTTDGETGSTGPQVAEALSEMYGFQIPHVTYIHDFDVLPGDGKVIAERKIGNVVQVLEFGLPAVITISHEYEPRVPPAGYMRLVRANSYKGKTRKIFVWNADDIGADVSRLGLAGSPTIVGPGVEVAKPPSRKVVGKSYVFVKDTGKFEWNGKVYGPFSKGDVADDLPKELVEKLKKDGLVELFTIEKLVKELFSGLLVSARQVYREKVVAGR